MENNTEVNVTIITILAEGITVDSEGRYVISSKVGFENFRNLANAGNNFSGKTVLLDTDIDLANEAWTPIYLNGDATKFAGVFDGNGKTISNLKVDLTATPAYQAAGLFGASNGTIKNLAIDGASVKNLTTESPSGTVNGTAVVVGSMAYGGTIENITVKNATVEANRYCGGIVGFVSGTVKDCVVDQISIVCTPDNLTGSYDNGDKCGGIYGYLNSEPTNSITGNAVTNFSIKGYRDLGGIGGTALVAGTISGNTATNGTIIIDQKTNSYGTKDANAHEIVGRSNATPTISDNTFENVEVVEYIADGAYRKNGVIYVTSNAVGVLKAATLAVNNGEKIVLPAGMSFDIETIYGTVATAFCQNKTVTFEGGDGTTMDFGHGYYVGTAEPRPLTNADNAKLTFKNIHLVNSTDTSNGSVTAAAEGVAMFMRASELNFENCQFTGNFVTVNNPVVNVTNCVFNSNLNCKYVFWIHSSTTAVVKNSEFHLGTIPGTSTTDGWIKIYTEAGDPGNINLTLDKCDFVGVSDEGTHNIKVDAKANYIITATECTSEMGEGKFIQVKNHAITFNGETMAAGTQK